MADNTKIQKMLCNGDWVDVDDIGETLNRVLSEPCKTNTMKKLTTKQDIIDHLEREGKLRFGCDWYDNIRVAPKPRPVIEPDMKICACGHTVAKSSVMMANMGSSCPDCYDRMLE